MHMNLRRLAAEMTDTKTRDWSFVDGPESGVGCDYWLEHKSGELGLYANLDQGEWSFEVLYPESA